MNSDLAKYFRDSGLSTVVLSGPKGSVPCKLLIRDKSVKIGSGWKRFCYVHGLNEKHKEDVLIFEIDGENKEMDVKVFYNMDQCYHRM